MNVMELEKSLKDNNLSSIYLLYGKETYLLENTLRKIKKVFGICKEGLNYIKIDNTNINSLIPELQTPAFGFDKKMIIVKDADVLKKQGKKKNQALSDQVDKIASFIEQNFEYIKDQVVLIFIEDEIEKNNLYKQIEKLGIICNFEQEKLPDLMKRIKYICNA